MKTVVLLPIPQRAELPLGDQTETVDRLLALCHEQREQLTLQAEQIQQLKDEIAVLKGEKPRPTIKPSGLNKSPPDRSTEGDEKPPRKRGKPSRKKTENLEIHQEQVIEPEVPLPPGTEFKGYEDYVVQELVVELKNTRYRRACYVGSDGERLIGDLPVAVKGSHFGPTLRRYILSQHYEQPVPPKLLLKQLWQWEVVISSGQLNRLLIHNHDSFHAEKAAVLRTGLEVSSHINVDDTGARHQGRNGYCTHIGNEWFAWFSSTESKSRINFLELLRAGETLYVVDEVARAYMQTQKLPQEPLALLSIDGVYADKCAWEAHLQTLGIDNDRHIRIATEGALVGSLVSQGIDPSLVIVSDDAGQFKVAGFLNALCWVHGERTIHKLIPGGEERRAIQAQIRGDIWTFYQDLKRYQQAPDEKTKAVLEQRFDEIFTQTTSWQTLNLALKRLHANKTELLLVLERPEIPLHNNLSENDIRDYVKRRKISATTRSEAGRQARDTFLSLKKTGQKLGICFLDYLHDRISQQHDILPLPALIRAAAQGP